MKIKYIAAFVTVHHLLATLFNQMVFAEGTNAVSDTLKDGLRQGTTDGPAMVQTVDTPNPFFLMLEVFGYLALIVGLIYLLMKWMAKKRWSAQSGKRIHILGGASFGPAKSIQVVKVGDLLYVLGVGENVQLIDKWSDPERVEQLLSEMEPELESPVVNAAKQWFSKWRDANKQGSERVKGEKIIRSFDQEDAKQTPFQRMMMDRMQQLPRRKEAMEKWLEEEAESKERKNPR